MLDHYQLSLLIELYSVDVETHFTPWSTSLLGVLAHLGFKKSNEKNCYNAQRF